MKKTDRLLIRLSETDKARIEAAAAADGRSMSNFILRTVLAACPEIGKQKPRRKAA